MSAKRPAGHPLEDRLFRLCILLKAAFWLTLIAVLGRVLWATATGGHPGDPAMLLGIVLGLGALQLAAVVIWWRVRARRSAAR